MNCPVCRDQTLTMTERSGVEIDYCPKCRGIWLDRGELDKLLERAASPAQGMPMAAAPSAPAPPPVVGQPSPAPYRRRDDDSVDEDYEDYQKRQRAAGYPPQPHAPHAPHGHPQGYPRKRKSWLGEILDFD